MNLKIRENIYSKLNVELYKVKIIYEMNLK